MPNIDRHSPGSFCWIELATTDQPAAKNFYQSLFNWTSEDQPMGPDFAYTMFRLDGRDVGAAYTMRPEQQQQGVPPNWRIYVAVTSAGDAARRAGELGGQVHIPAFDAGDHGRMAVIADPTGAVFSVWQAKQHPGVGITGVAGTFCWADLSTPGTAAAQNFYSQLFGWDIKAGEHDPSGYLHIFNGQNAIGGIPPAEYRDPNTPPHWLLYFFVPDCASALEKAVGLGATALMPTREIPKVGSMAIVKDPHGAVFAFYQAPSKPVA
jgi:uncharacterized protein